MLYKNYIRVLYIDLSNEKFRVEERSDLWEYLGGVGVASKLLEEEMRADLDALAPEQVIVFANGVISSIFPVVTKTVAMFISPLTGELGESYAGGRMALTMLMAGYDAIVLTGRHRRQSYLSIKTHNVEFKDARAFKGMSAKEIGRYIRDKEAGSGKRSILRIGPAGENGVAYASVCVDTYRHFGRLGLGAIIGSKNLKAISIMGDRVMPIAKPIEYLKAYRLLFDKSTETNHMQKYHDIGTAVNLEPLSEMGALPTNNMQSGSFAAAEEISGERFAEENLVRKMACAGCPVGCIHVGQFRREFDKGHEYESISVGYDYELLYALGSFLGIEKRDEILSLIDKVEDEGMDAMSTGVVLGWATEAQKKEMLTEEQTLVKLEFGNAENYLKAIEYIADRKNEFYTDLGKGVAKASKIYGGEDFAMAIAGNEMSGYHTGYGALVGTLVGARHSHLCNGGYALDQSMKDFDAEKMVDTLWNEEVERCLLNSLIICLFARKVYDRETILLALNVIGRSEITNEELTRISREIYKTKLRIKAKLNFVLENVQLPQRYFETPSMKGTLDKELVLSLIGKFQEKNKILMAE
ncbi:MAG: aldehyde ferredoxin oxidoreductase C-terminal domain-containing protein [Clostridia bacterium]